MFYFECNVLVHALHSERQPIKRWTTEQRAQDRSKQGQTWSQGWFVKLVPASCDQVQPVAASFLLFSFVFYTGVQTGYS